MLNIVAIIVFVILVSVVGWLMAYQPKPSQDRTQFWWRRAQDWPTEMLLYKEDAELPHAVGEEPRRGTMYVGFHIEPSIYKWFFNEQSKFWIGKETNDLAEHIIARYEKPITDRIQKLLESPNLEHYVNEV